MPEKELHEKIAELMKQNADMLANINDPKRNEAMLQNLDWDILCDNWGVTRTPEALGVLLGQTSQGRRAALTLALRLVDELISICPTPKHHQKQKKEIEELLNE